MRCRITAADVQAALDGFVQAGLVREFLPSPSEAPVARRKRFGKRERALIKQIIKEFCPRFAPGATVVYIGDAESKFLHLEAAYLKGLGVVIAPSAKMPDVVVHDTKRNWLLLAEAVTSAGSVDWKRRNELKDLFKGCKAGLLFVKAFETRRAMQSFLPQISWETEVWVAEDPDHLIHFDGERFLGPYPDVMPGRSY
ncbi:MAG: BsuBI/PstI family type II restriction endonuclease [Verrucomicrobiota bacterium]